MLRTALRPISRSLTPLAFKPTLIRRTLVSELSTSPLLVPDKNPNPPFRVCVCVCIGKRFTQDHEWISFDDSTGLGTFGITHYAQKNLGDVVFVELPVVESQIAKGESIGNVESVKAVGEIYAPVSGQVKQVNEELEGTPELINQDPESTGKVPHITSLEE